MSEKVTFEIRNIDIYEKGYLGGYMTAYLSMSNKPDIAHEVLYRIKDDKNGKPNTIVSVDYGYKNPAIEECWGEIEAELLRISQEANK